MHIYNKKKLILEKEESRMCYYERSIRQNA